MDIDERIAALTMNLELMSRDREDDNKRLYEQGRQIQALFLRAEKDGEFIREVAETVKEVAKRVKEVAESVNKLAESVNKLGENVKKDSENIRALARIAEIHERRLTGMEGTPAE